ETERTRTTVPLCWTRVENAITRRQGLSNLPPRCSLEHSAQKGSPPEPFELRLNRISDRLHAVRMMPANPIQGASHFSAAADRPTYFCRHWRTSSITSS